MGNSSIETIDEDLGLWSAEMQSSAGFSTRTTILKLSDDSLALISPTRGLEDLIAELGTPAFLIAPNHFHHLGMGRYLKRWPEAKPVASSGAIPRLLKKSTVDSYSSLDSLRPLLPKEASLLEPPGLKNGELILRVETKEGVTWSLGDSFFNLSSHPTGTMGLVCRLTRTSAGLRLGRTFTSFAVKDKKVYGSWLREQLDADRPSILIPGHGAIYRGQGLYEELDAECRGRLKH